MTALWVRRVISLDPLVRNWERDHAAQLFSRSAAGHAPQTVEELEQLIAAEFAAEGGAAIVAEVLAKSAKAHGRNVAGQGAWQTVVRRLPNRTRIEIPASELVARRPVVTLTYPSAEVTASLTVLRDGQLGQLAMMADLLAERYLVPASEILYCILTGQPPRPAPIRMGVRFRRFDVDGVPVTATSRVVFDVDPQLEPAEIARLFAQWQQSNGVKASKPSPTLAKLAADLAGRVSLAPEDPHPGSRPTPGERLGIGNSSWWLVPKVPWLRLARETKCDPHLIRARTGAVIHLLLPLDAARSPRWFPQ